MLTENRLIKERHLQLCKSKEKALQYKIENELDSIKKVNYQIEQFYVQDCFENLEIELNNEKMGNKKIVITKEESDKKIDTKIKKYNRIISLLNTKKTLLFNKADSEKDELEKVNMLLEIESIDAEVLAKESFIKAYIERKNVV